MHVFTGRIVEIRWDMDQGRSAVIKCNPTMTPGAGRYLMAWSPGDPDAPLAYPIFLSEIVPGGFAAAPPIPSTWEPGMDLNLRGPLGHGFSLPGNLRRLALAALGATHRRLLTLISAALDAGVSIALYTDLRLPGGLPSAVEINPLAALPEALTWADFLALDLPLSSVEHLPARLGIPPEVRRLPCQAQVLVIASMPCGGIGDCGACALKTSRGWKLVCKDGPVFPVEALL